MAKFNEILVGRFNRGLQKLVGVKGLVPSPQIGSEWVPALSLPLTAVDHYLFSWDLFASTQNPAAVVGQFPFMQILNPTGSNVLVEILKIVATPAAAGDRIQLGHGPGTAQGLAAAQIGRIDARTVRNSGVTVTFGNSATPQTGHVTIGNWIAAAITSFDLIVDSTQALPLMPGDSSVVNSTTANTAAFFASFLWRERYLEESERT